MKSQNIQLTDHHDDFIRQSIQLGHFTSADEVIRAGLRLLEQNEQEKQIKLEILRRLLDEGANDIEQGRFGLVTESSLDQFIGSVSATRRLGKTA